MPIYSVKNEALVQAIYEAVLRPGDVAIDVGARHGRHSTPMAVKVFPGGRVLAFETSAVGRESIAQELSGYRTELASLVKIQPFELGDVSGKAEVPLTRDSFAYRDSAKQFFEGPAQLKYQSCEVKRLDELCGGLPSLRYIKIDSDEKTFQILRGAEATLRRFRPAVSFEFSVGFVADQQVSPEQMAQFWAALNYKIFDSKGAFLTHEEFIASGYKQSIRDYVAVPAEDEDLIYAAASALANPPDWRVVVGYLENADYQARHSELCTEPAEPGGVKNWLFRFAGKVFGRSHEREITPLRGSVRSLAHAFRALLEMLRERARETRRQQDHLEHLTRDFKELHHQLELANRKLQDLTANQTCVRCQQVERAA
jgi:FkbM family methyltransferase